MKMVFDVESVGLHGEGFAVGWTILNRAGEELGSGLYSCPLDAATGADSDREWVQANVMPHLGAPNCETPQQVRDAFWKEYQTLKATGPVELWTDCGWPVEANFLTACVKDAPEDRNWEGPYPLLDVAVMLRAAGFDPIGNYGMRPDDEPAHNPLFDARQSARVLAMVEAKMQS